jgi:hypothetical protein
MYGIFLLLHSWWRWVVVAAAVVAVGRALAGTLRRSPWKGRDENAGLAFTIGLDVQAALGIALYLFMSPNTRRAMGNFGAAMSDAVLRYWSMEHVAMAVLAVIVAHIGRVAVGRAGSDASRHRRALVAYAIAALLVMAAVPWPVLENYGRPLFRFAVP